MPWEWEEVWQDVPLPVKIRWRSVEMIPQEAASQCGRRLGWPNGNWLQAMLQADAYYSILETGKRGFTRCSVAELIRQIKEDRRGAR